MVSPTVGLASNGARFSTARAFLGWSSVELGWRAPAEMEAGDEFTPESLRPFSRHADDAIRTLPNGPHVVLTGVAHGWSNVDQCGAAFVADFVNRATTRGLDVACARTSSAPKFVTP